MPSLNYFGHSLRSTWDFMFFFFAQQFLISALGRLKLKKNRNCYTRFILFVNKFEPFVGRYMNGWINAAYFSIRSDSCLSLIRSTILDTPFLNSRFVFFLNCALLWWLYRNECTDIVHYSIPSLEKNQMILLRVISPTSR